MVLMLLIQRQQWCLCLWISMSLVIQPQWGSGYHNLVPAHLAEAYEGVPLWATQPLSVASDTKACCLGPGTLSFHSIPGDPLWGLLRRSDCIYSQSLKFSPGPGCCSLLTSWSPRVHSDSFCFNSLSTTRKGLYFQGKKKVIHPTRKEEFQTLGTQKPICYPGSVVRAIPFIPSGWVSTFFPSRERGTLKKKIMFICFGERQSASRAGAKRKGDTESETGSRPWAVHTGPDTGLKTINPWDHDLSQSRTLNQLSHPGAWRKADFYYSRDTHTQHANDKSSLVFLTHRNTKFKLSF